MTKVAHVFGILLLCTTAGCTNLPSAEEKKDSNNKFVSFQNSQVSIPEAISVRPTANPSRLIANNDDNNNGLDGQEYGLELQRFTSCSPDLGMSNPDVIEAEGSVAKWGKMPIMSAYDRGYNTPCHIFAPNCTDRELFEGTCITQSATYAFCAEKDGKAVAICIQQMTDDPTLAENIFQSFRWMEE